jgi:hypothetical protein
VIANSLWVSHLFWRYAVAFVVGIQAAELASEFVDCGGFIFVTHIHFVL